METVIKKKRWNREWLTSYLFLLPALSFFLIFVVTPMVKGIYISFFNYTGAKFDFIGLENYTYLFHNEVFLKALRNTVMLVVAAVPIVIIFSLFVSMNIYKKSERLRSFFRAIFYLPAVSSVVSITVVWGWIYHPNFGVLNYITSLFGIQPISWLGDARFALAAIIVVLITTSVGQPIILYTASLGNIPSTYIEAAEIDGANNWQIFRKIIWPLLMPTSLYVIIITTINSFQCFALIKLLTAGGPFYSTTTIMYEVYEKAFTLAQYGIASAMGVILAIVIVTISIIQFRYFGKDVEY
ncbi:carbohydrate ABC transporter permease [Neobacillus mesonae]|uniref:carbohydrate ABC transporter permease n=1 Tax=Neobacillus mesonae TaxID=1193713 RepID=UPI00257398BB|nr:sugar ABC transporter permease [Neobacillus mesonae]MED4203698.1 sugar ABC transporter permease [Neobacillus mesonae]